jgi:hypothetical protein
MPSNAQSADEFVEWTVTEWISVEHGLWSTLSDSRHEFPVSFLVAEVGGSVPTEPDEYEAFD